MLSQKLQDDLMTAYQKVYEEKRGHAAGASDVEKQASQLASDVRYKAKGKVKPGASEEEKKKIFLQILNSSPAPTAVKAMAKSKLLGEEVVTEMRFDDGKSGERLKALAKKRKIPMSKMKNHPQFKDVKEGMGDELIKKPSNPDLKKTFGNPKKGKETPPAVKKDMEDKNKQFGVTSEGSSYGITKGSGKPSGQMAAFAKEEEDELDTQREKLENKMKTKRVNKMIAKSAKSEKKLAKELMGEMKAPRMQKGAMAYDGPNKERSEAADRVIAKTKAKRAKMKKEEVELGEMKMKAKPKNPKDMSKGIGQAAPVDYRTLAQSHVPVGNIFNEKMDPVGQEDKDIDNDGDHDSTDKYLLKRRKAIGKAIAKKRGKVKEGFSAGIIDLDFNEQVKK